MLKLSQLLPRLPQFSVRSLSLSHCCVFPIKPVSTDLESPTSLRSSDLCQPGSRDLSPSSDVIHIARLPATI